MRVSGPNDPDSIDLPLVMVGDRPRPIMAPSSIVGPGDRLNRTPDPNVEAGDSGFPALLEYSHSFTGG